MKFIIKFLKKPDNAFIRGLQVRGSQSKFLLNKSSNESINFVEELYLVVELLGNPEKNLRK